MNELEGHLQVVEPIELLSMAGLLPSKNPRWKEHVSRIE
jgi:hypothetical protein